MTDHAATLRRGARSHRGPDRLTVMLLTLAAFLAVFAILAARLQAVPAAPAPPPQVVVLRRVYQTTIVDDGSRNGRGDAATVSVSSSGTAPTTAPVAAPTTRTSSHP